MLIITKFSLPAFKNRSLKSGVSAFYKLLDAKKAEKISVINLERRNTLCDAMMICTGLGERHVVSLSHALRELADSTDFSPISVEGEAGGRWVVVDCGEIVVHIMTEESRNLYNLEKLWGHPFDDEDALAPLERKVKKRK